MAFSRLNFSFYEIILRLFLNLFLKLLTFFQKYAIVNNTTQGGAVGSSLGS